MKIPQRPPKLDTLIKELYNKESFVRVLISNEVAIHPTVEGKYVHWDKLRYLSPPEGFSIEEWWYFIDRKSVV